MAWNPNIPQPTDKLSVSQADILANFQALDPIVNGVDQFVLLPVQGSAPTTSATQIAIYSRVSALTGIAELALRRPSSGVITEFTSSTQSNNGWTRLPSGILLKWGQGTANGLTTITFPVAASVPAFTQIFSIQVATGYVNGSDGDGFVRLNQYIAPWTSFTAYGSARTTVTNKSVSFDYLAIGI